MFAGHCIRQSKRRKRTSNCWSLRLCSCGQVLFVRVSCKGCYQWKKYSGCLQKISNGKSIFNFLLLTEALKGRFVFILLIKINQKLRVGTISSPSGSCKTKKKQRRKCLLTPGLGHATNLQSLLYFLTLSLLYTSLTSD